MAFAAPLPQVDPNPTADYSYGARAEMAPMTTLWGADQNLTPQQRHLQQLWAWIEESTRKIQFTTQHRADPNPESLRDNPLWLDPVKDVGQSASALDAEQRDLREYWQQYTSLHNQIKKDNPDQLRGMTEVRAIPLLDQNGRIISQINPLNPTAVPSTHSIQSADNAASTRQQERARQSADERNRQTVSAQLRVADMAKARSELDALVRTNAQLIQRDAQSVSLANKQTDAAIHQYDSSVNLFGKAIDKMTDVGLEEMKAWVELQKLPADVYKTTATMITQANDRLSREDVAGYNAQATYQVHKLDKLTGVAKEMYDTYQKSLADTVYAPQEWWDTYQKAQLALSAGRRVPQDVLKALLQPGDMGLHAARPDPNFYPSTLASLMGGNATAENPAGFQAPFAPGARYRLPDEPQVDWASQPNLNDTRQIIGLGLQKGLYDSSVPGAIPTGGDPRQAGGMPTLPPAGGGFDPASITAPETAPDQTAIDTGFDPFGGSPDTGPEPDFGPQDDGAGGGFNPPDGGFNALTQAYLMPVIQIPDFPPDLIPNAAAATTAIYQGHDPEDAVNQAFAGTGYSWTMSEENKRLQDLLAGLGGADDNSFDWGA